MNDNKQNDNVALPEKEARGMYRKWDNIKSIVEYVKTNGRAKKKHMKMVYGDLVLKLRKDLIIEMERILGLE